MVAGSGSHAVLRIGPRGLGRDRRRLLLVTLLSFGAVGGEAFAQDVVLERRVAEVAWSQAGFAEAPPPHSAEAAAVIRKVQLPVLIPASFTRYKSFEVVAAGPYDYTASVRLPGAKLWINGTRQEVIAPRDATAAQEFQADPNAFVEPDPPQPVVIDRRFSRFGVGYVISAECARPDDARCRPEALDALERTVRVFGGKE